jgi:hypothetical protein
MATVEASPLQNNESLLDECTFDNFIKEKGIVKNIIGLTPSDVSPQDALQNANNIITFLVNLIKTKIELKSLRLLDEKEKEEKILMYIQSGSKDKINKGILLLEDKANEFITNKCLKHYGVSGPPKPIKRTEGRLLPSTVIIGKNLETYKRDTPLNIEDMIGRKGLNITELRSKYKDNRELQKKYKTVDDYIDSFNPGLNKMNDLLNKDADFDAQKLNEAIKSSGITIRNPSQVRPPPKLFYSSKVNPANMSSHDEDVLAGIFEPEKDYKTLKSKTDEQFSSFKTSFEKLIDSYDNSNPLYSKLKNEKDKLVVKIDKLVKNLEDINNEPQVDVSAKLAVVADISDELLQISIKRDKENTIQYEFNLIKLVFDALNYFYRLTFFDELVPIQQPEKAASNIITAHNNYMNDTNSQLNLGILIAECAKQGSRADFITFQEEFNKYRKGSPISDVNNQIKTAFIELIAGLLDAYPVDIDINKKIKIASKKEKEYIYGYTVKLKMEYSVLEDKDCERAIPDGGFNEIGLKMTNRTRVAQINEERSKCKHGDTVIASFSNLFKPKGGRRKTRKLNNRKLKSRKTKRHRKKTNRRLQKKQRKTHKRR